jgi:hypothetical protein
MSRTIYPYPTLFGDVRLEVTRVRVDGHALDFSRISHSKQTVALASVGRENWQEAWIEVEVTLPESEIADGPWSELTCVLTLEESATNTKIVRRLTKDRGSGTWLGAVPLLRSRHRSRAMLGVQVVASVGGVRGRTVGREAQNWTIDLRADTPAQEQEVRILTVDFRDGPHDWLRSFKEVPWLVETSGDMPTVYLNECVEGLVRLLRGGGTSLEKATAALVNAQLVSDAWETMFHAAVSDVEFDDHGRPATPTGWRGSVLETMLPDVLPGLSPTDALVELRTRREEGYGWTEVQSRVQYAASLRAQLPKHLVATLRATSRPSKEEDR